MSELVADVCGTGPPVVLLHGQPGSRADWAAVARRLMVDHQVIVPDRPGYGETGGRARGFRGNAAAVVSLLDRLGVARATIVGYSWAGGVALALAQEVPERVTSLVLVSSVRPGEPLSRMDRMLAVPPIGAAVTAAGLFLATNALALPPVRQAVQRRRRRLDQEAGTDEVGFRDSPDPNAVLTAMRSNRVWQSFVTEQRCLIDELPFLAPGLAGIAIPTLVLQGDSDRTVPPATGRRLAAAIPGARLVELAATGHLVIHHRPNAVAAAVRQLAPF
jgi:pimeloyl-ACP methyl ester carboxylesterase